MVRLARGGAQPGSQSGAGLGRPSFPVAFYGMLLKRSGTKGTTFQNRFFVLHGHLLSYFKEPSDSIPVGSLVLNDSASLQIPSESARLREFEFHLCLKQKTYHLVAFSVMQLNLWIDRIAKAIYGSKFVPLDAPPTPPPKSPSWSLLSQSIYRGQLKKQGGSRKSWHDRYFVLVAGSAPALFYFKDIPEGHSINCLGSIALRSSYLIPDVSEAILPPTAFAIMTEDRQYFLEAISEDDRAVWFHAFDKALCEANSADREAQQKRLAECFNQAGVVDNVDMLRNVLISAAVVESQFVEPAAINADQHIFL